MYRDQAFTILPIVLLLLLYRSITRDIIFQKRLPNSSSLNLPIYALLSTYTPTAIIMNYSTLTSIGPSPIERSWITQLANLILLTAARNSLMLLPLNQSRKFLRQVTLRLTKFLFPFIFFCNPIST